jgi:hypothetical protein
MPQSTTTITPHAAYATLINVFTVEPERADELATLLTGSTEEVMQHLPGSGRPTSTSARTAPAW